jgi:hypothetical protein
LTVTEQCFSRRFLEGPRPRLIFFTLIEAFAKDRFRAKPDVTRYFGNKALRFFDVKSYIDPEANRQGESAVEREVNARVARAQRSQMRFSELGERLSMVLSYRAP